MFLEETFRSVLLLNIYLSIKLKESQKQSCQSEKVDVNSNISINFKRSVVTFLTLILKTYSLNRFAQFVVRLPLRRFKSFLPEKLAPTCDDWTCSGWKPG